MDDMINRGAEELMEGENIGKFIKLMLIGWLGHVGM